MTGKRKPNIDGKRKKNSAPPPPQQYEVRQRDCAWRITYAVYLGQRCVAAYDEKANAIAEAKHLNSRTCIHLPRQ